VNIVKKPLHWGVIDCDDREIEFAFPCHRPEPVHTSGCFLTAPYHVQEEIGPRGMQPVNEIHTIIDRHPGVGVKDFVNGCVVFLCSGSPFCIAMYPGNPPESGCNIILGT